jgi:hypothetical protein
MPKTCPVCASAAERFLVREGVPANQNLLLRSRESARAVKRGTLDLHACTTCGFVFNAAFVPENLEYGATYENTQTASPTFAQYLDERVAGVVDACAERNASIVEVGCGKGTFLARLVEAMPGSTAFGFDTSYEGPTMAGGGRLHFYKHYFAAETAPSKVDALVCRHVIEHVPDPVGFLDSIRAPLDGSTSKVFFETPCVSWIVRNHVVWDFFYEHCSYFNPVSIRLAFTRAGFTVSSVRHVFGGQYLWLEGSLASTIERDAVATDGGACARSCQEFAKSHAAAVTEWAKRLTALREKGRLAIWGAGAKGVTFAGLVDPDVELIDCVIDVNPRKQGCFIPGTGHPIVAPAELRDRDIRTAVLMNPNYRGENESLLHGLGLEITLIA